MDHRGYSLVILSLFAGDGGCWMHLKSKGILYLEGYSI